MNKFLSKMTNRHWCSLLILLFVLIGLVIGLNTWLPAQPKKIVKAKARTELINMAALESIAAPVDQQASYLALYELGFWDGLLGQKSIEVQSWRIMGGFMRAKQSYVVVKVADLPAQELKQGDELPDGSQIVRIRDSEICIRLAAKSIAPFAREATKAASSPITVAQGRPASAVAVVGSVARPSNIGASLPVVAQWNVLAEIKVGLKPYFVVMPAALDLPQQAANSANTVKTVTPPGDIIVNGEKVSFRSGVVAKAEKSKSSVVQPGDRLATQDYLLQPSKGVICLPLSGPALETR
ncbi:hypothetical protein [Deefgea piscis]|uniref:hypothetical protein n=1 Tax=Deefgea piscis TaxID=2739061 RepID=UPI001C8116C6|nr:hypothetical protein [Deefgea piscis]QZA80546.1 hypothetical protein K4H25_13645 [Deefgea piscis]